MAALAATADPAKGVAQTLQVCESLDLAGEATNCHFNKVGFVDVHVALAKNPGDGEKEAIVVEPTPRFYAQHPAWVCTELNAGFDCA